MATVPTREPESLRAGLTWAWTRTFSDYPASTWTLKYWLKNAANTINITAAADGDTHSVSVAASTTAAYAPGHYDWVATVESGTEKYQVDYGRVQVLPDIQTTTALDQRSQARVALEAIRAVLARRATQDQQAYTIEGRSLQRTPVADLIRLESHYATQVAAEEAAERLADGRAPRRIHVRF